MKEICDRCSVKLTASIMSKFNRDVLCIPCKEDEKLAPGYAHADEAECQQVRNGNHNFAGVGLPAEAAAFLRERRLTRNAPVPPTAS